MPNLSKRKRHGKRGGVGDTVWSGRAADKVLREHAEQKFERRQERSTGKGWKFGHMSANQALTQSDKYWMNQVSKARHSRGVDSGRQFAGFAKEERGPNGGISLDSFADKHAAIHSMRTRFRIRNERDSDFDPSDSDLDDPKFIRSIRDGDNPFSMGSKKKKKRRLRRAADISDGDSDQMAESDYCEDSGDDLERDEHGLKDVIDPSQMEGVMSSDEGNDAVESGDEVLMSEEQSSSSENESDASDIDEDALPDFAESRNPLKKRRLVAKSKDGRTVELVQSQAVSAPRRFTKKESKKDLKELLDDSSEKDGRKSRKLWQLSGEIENDQNIGLSLWNRNAKNDESSEDSSDDDESSDNSSSDGPTKVTDLSGLIGTEDDLNEQSEGDFSSSDEDVDMMERRKTREQTLAEQVTSGVGRLKWGRHKSNYYGTDTTRSALNEVDQDEADEELRTEEAIGIQQQIDTQMSTRTTDYFDEEIMAVMRHGVAKQKRKKKNELYREMYSEKQKVLDELNEQEKALDAEALAEKEGRTYVPPVSAAASVARDGQSGEESDNEDGGFDEKIVKSVDKNNSSLSEERVTKDLSVYDDDELMKVVLRQHPELPGVLSELKQVLAEMNTVKSEYDRIQEKQYDKAMKDSALFLELLRNYAAVLSFYLTLKSKNSGHVSENHPIFGRMLEMKNAVANFRPIYNQTFEQFQSLPEDFDREQWAQKDREMIEEGEKVRLKALEDERNFNEKLRKSEEKRREKERERVRKEREERYAHIAAEQAEKAEKYARKEDWRLKQWHIRVEKDNESDVRSGAKNTGLAFELEDEEDKEENIERRHINNRIFKSMGLKRYRKPGIPRLKQKLKYEKRLKQLRMRGYRPYKGKLPYTRGERRINTHVTHSTKF